MKEHSFSKKFVIVDGHALIHRAYHAIPAFTTEDGLMVNAVYGFFSILLKVLSDIEPTHFVVSFDVGGGTFRNEVYTEYKATREKADDDLYNQIPLIQEVLKDAGVVIYSKKGYEADDVIGTIVKEIEEKYSDTQCIIVTGDKDLLQLVSIQTNVYLLKTGMSNFLLFDPKKVKEVLGFGPELLVTYKALRGDSSDNIPGIVGVGDKTAKIILDHAKTVGEIYRQIQDEASILVSVLSKKMREKIIDGKESAEMSYTLAKIDQFVPSLNFDIEKTVSTVINYKKLEEAFRRFEFFSLIKRLPGEKKVRKEHIEKTVSRVSAENVEIFLSLLEQETVFVCKEVVDGGVVSGYIEGMIFVFEKSGMHYLDFSYCKPADRARVFAHLTNSNISVVGHNVKELVKVILQEKQQAPTHIFDIMIASYIVKANSRAHDLPALILRELDIQIVEQKQQTLFGADIEGLAKQYQYVFELYHHYQTALKRTKQESLFQEVEMALIPVLAQMELHGISIDAPYLSDMSVEIHKQLDQLTQNIYQLAGKEFNVASSVQLREILFVELALPTRGIKKGKTGYSTAAAELEKLRGEHEIIEYIETFRELSKLQNTYIDVLPTLVNKKTGRIHTTFNQSVTATGRLSSSDPNLQNIPIRTEAGKKIRKAFVAASGTVFIAADYSQIELRVVASLSKDKKMLEIFHRDEDIHTATAAIIHGVGIADVTPELRRSAKEINFGVLYGMGAYGLSARTGLSVVQSQEFIDAYFAGFSGVKTYLDTVLEEAKESGYVETLLGRRRYVPELHAKNRQIRTSGERMAINMPVQGTAADMMKLAMIAVYKKIAPFGDKVKMLLQVHDEIVLEVKESLAEKIARLVEKEMECVVDMDVPIKVEAHIGKDWGELK
ncbi:DNA polymerase I [Patescibacteria group bacterium]|nr:DNA polymerase I [Patescibacteria group bacterium]MBU1721292.1 DNA polymerase I [Patescibacteria group bacterium]MBU1901000.1 DNA polymerase I [Patescibacteria group bacterium]